MWVSGRLETCAMPSSRECVASCLICVYSLMEGAYDIIKETNIEFDSSQNHIYFISLITSFYIIYVLRLSIIFRSYFLLTPIITMDSISYISFECDLFLSHLLCLVQSTIYYFPPRPLWTRFLIGFPPSTPTLQPPPRCSHHHCLESQV